MKQEGLVFLLLKAWMLFGLVSVSFSSILRHRQSVGAKQIHRKLSAPRKASLREVKSRPQLLKELMQKAHNRQTHKFEAMGPMGDMISNALLSPFSAGRGQALHVQHHSRTQIHHRRSSHHRVRVVKNSSPDPFGNVGELLGLGPSDLNPIGSLSNKITVQHHRRHRRHSSTRLRRSQNALTAGQNTTQRGSDQAFDNAIKQAFGIPTTSSLESTGNVITLPDGVATLIPIADGVIDLSMPSAPNSINGNSLPSITQIFSGSSNPNSFSDNNDPQAEQQVFGPFATILKELLNDSKDMVKQRYNDGSNLDEDDYHHKILEPVEIVYRNPKTSQGRPGLITANNLGQLVERFKPIVFKMNLPGSSFEPAFFQTGESNKNNNQLQNQSEPELPFLANLPFPLQMLFKTFFNLLNPISALNNALSTIHQRNSQRGSGPTLIQNLRANLPPTNSIAGAFADRNPTANRNSSEDPTAERDPNKDPNDDYLDHLRNLLDKINDLLRLKKILAKLKQHMNRGNPIENSPNNTKLEQAVSLIEDLIKNINILKDLHKSLLDDNSSGQPLDKQDPNNRTEGNGNTSGDSSSRPNLNNFTFEGPNSTVNLMQKLFGEPMSPQQNQFNPPENILNLLSNPAGNNDPAKGLNSQGPSGELRDILNGPLGPMDLIKKLINPNYDPQNNLNSGNKDDIRNPQGSPAQKDNSEANPFGFLNELLEKLRDILSQLSGMPNNQHQGSSNNKGNVSDDPNDLLHDLDDPLTTKINQQDLSNLPNKSSGDPPIFVNNPELNSLINNLKQLGFDVNPLIQYFNAQDPSSKLNANQPGSNDQPYDKDQKIFGKDQQPADKDPRGPGSNPQKLGGDSLTNNGPVNVLFNVEPDSNDDLIKTLKNLIDKLEALKNIQSQNRLNDPNSPGKFGGGYQGDPNGNGNRYPPSNRLGNNPFTQIDTTNLYPQGRPNDNLRQPTDVPNGSLNDKGGVRMPNDLSDGTINPGQSLSTGQTNQPGNNSNVVLNYSPSKTQDTYLNLPSVTNVLPSGQPAYDPNDPRFRDNQRPPNDLNPSNNLLQVPPNQSSLGDMLDRQYQAQKFFNNQFDGDNRQPDVNPTINNYHFNHNVKVDNPNAALNGLDINHSTQTLGGKHHHKIVLDIHTKPQKKVTVDIDKEPVDPCLEKNCDKDIEERVKEIMKIQKTDQDEEKKTNLLL